METWRRQGRLVENVQGSVRDLINCQGKYREAYWFWNIALVELSIRLMFTWHSCDVKVCNLIKGAIH